MRSKFQSRRGSSIIETTKRPFQLASSWLFFGLPGPNPLDTFIVSGGRILLADEDQPDVISEERRQYDRSRRIVDVHFEGVDATGVASTKDMSLGGLYMSTQTDIPVGTTLTLRIPLGGEHAIVKADVVYSNPGHGVGVRFHRLSDETRALMERELPAP